jgi:cytochrome c
VDQNRLVGAQRGVATAGGADKPAAAAPASAAPKAGAVPQALLDKNGCTACHGMEQKIVGPALADIGKKYAGQAAYLSERIRAGSSGVWGNIPMPPQALSPEDAQAIAQWLATRQ